MKSTLRKLMVYARVKLALEVIKLDLSAADPLLIAARKTLEEALH
jgi:hypothetical protein